MFPDQTTDVLFTTEQNLKLENELFKSGLNLTTEPREVVNFYRKKIFFRDNAAGDSEPFININGKEMPFKEGITQLLQDSNSRFLSYDSAESKLKAEFDAIEKRRAEGRSLQGDIERRVGLQNRFAELKQTQEAQRPKTDHSAEIKKLNEDFKQAENARDVKTMISLKNRLAALTLESPA